MSELKVGPKGRTKTGVEIQKTLGEFLEKDDSILNFKKIYTNLLMMLINKNRILLNRKRK